MSARANRPDGALTSRCGRPAGTTRRTGRADTTPTLAAGLRHEVRGLKFPHPTPHRGPCVSTPKQLTPCTKPPSARRRPAATAQRKHNGTSTGGAEGQHQPTAGEAEGSVFSPRPLRQRTGDERGTHPPHYWESRAEAHPVPEVARENRQSWNGQRGNHTKLFRTIRKGMTRNRPKTIQ